MPEPDTVPRHLRLAQPLSIGPDQIRPVLDSEDVDGDPGAVRAHPDLEELPGASVGIGNGMQSISCGGVGDRLVVTVLAIIEP